MQKEKITSSPSPQIQVGISLGYTWQIKNLLLVVSTLLMLFFRCQFFNFTAGLYATRPLSIPFGFFFTFQCNKLYHKSPPIPLHKILILNNMLLWFFITTRSSDAHTVTKEKPVLFIAFSCFPFYMLHLLLRCK